MPVDAGIGTLPRSDEAVAAVARLLDHEGLQGQPQPLFLAREHEVLPEVSGRLLRPQLEKPGARDHGYAFDRLKALRRRYIGPSRTVARRNPAAVDQYGRPAAL